ncbi:PTS transporter subunit EIIC [Rothia terrae]|uniref:glucose PTS transporter subunit IIA n=1 Tax=Rothia terrae TaxID=396015 RepID=UPI00144802BE|nr:PTS transporter subunit EIIC [Rothia terrae]
MNNSEMGKKILEGLGGPENISHFTHCATRLRVTPKSKAAIDKKAIENVPGVLSIIEQSGQTQVVLGDKVEAVYNEMQKLPGVSGVGEGSVAAGNEVADPNEKKANWITRTFDVLSDSFRPVLWALLGSSMILTLIVLLQQLGVFGTYTNFAGEVVNKDLVNGPKLGDAALNADMLNSWRTEYTFWFLILAASLSVLNFMPIMIGATAAKRLGANMWVGAAIPAALMTDAFRGLSEILPEGANHLDLFHIGGWAVPLYLFSYTGQIFPPLFAAALLAPLERFLKKIIPTMLHMVFVPMISILILVPLTALVIGPFGILLGQGISDLFGWLNDIAPWLVGAVIAGTYLFMVPLGLHWPLNAVMINNLQTNGFDFIQSPMAAYNFAVFGLVTGVAIRAKHDKELRQTATGAAVSGLLGGISEPSLYGVVLRYKRVFPLILVPAVIGGALISALGVRSYAFAFTSLLSIPAMQPIPLFVIGLAVAFFGAMAGVLIFGYESKAQAAESRAKRDNAPAIDAEGGEAAVVDTVESGAPVAHESEVLHSGARTAPAGTAAAAGATASSASATAAPVATSPDSYEAGTVLAIASPIVGRAIPLSEVPDPIFAAAKLGKGAAIEPTGNTVVAPADGKVIATPASGHAVGLKLDNGAELLIHVGIDTVNLGGEGFDVKVKKGERVTAGQTLLTFDHDVIKKAGYPLTTPVLVTNTVKFDDVEGATGDVTQSDKILKITTK